MSTLFQHSTIGALMAGLFEGTLPLKELLQHGTMGIGTLNGLDGELVILDGAPYQVKVDGIVEEVHGEMKTPYAAVINFTPDDMLKIRERVSSEQLEDKLLAHFSSENTFQAVKVTGLFKRMHCRSVEKQEPPYPRLAEVAEDQAEFIEENMVGTLVGFYTPEIFGTVAVPGFHLHFLNDGRDYGGHVLDFEMENGTAEWQTVETLEQHFPLGNETFMQSDIDYDNLADDIKKSE